MKIYNYSEARQNFATVLNASMNEEVIIKRKDGSRFKITPIINTKKKSPFDIEGIDTQIGTDQLLKIIRESREFR
jgi:hypothetical protein